MRQVARTRSHSLSALICAEARRASAFSRSLPLQLSTLLFSMQDRIQSLYLFLPAPLFTSMATLRLRMAILRNLALLSTNGEEFRSLIHMELFGDARLLSTLHTVDIGNIFVLSLPYHQITHYSVLSDRKPGPSTHYIFPLLSAGNLEACDLRCEVLFPGKEYSRSCLKLQTLTLSSWASAYPRSVLARLLNALTLPRLSTLTVHCCVNEGHVRDTEQTFAAIRGAICRSQSPFDHISLHSR